MTLLDIARALHVIAVAHWVGGLAFVTLVILPWARSAADPAKRLALFEAVENRFAAQARLSVPIAGLSGLYLLHFAGGVVRLSQSWPIAAMLAIWTVFMLMLFVAEPLFLHAWFRRQAMIQSDRLFAWAQGLHLVLLLVSAVVIGAGVLSAHGALR